MPEDNKSTGDQRKKLEASGKVITAYSYPLSPRAKAAIARAFEKHQPKKDGRCPQ